MLFLEELKTIYKKALTFPQACGSLAKSTWIRYLFDTRPPHLKNSVAVSYHLQASMQFKIQSSGYFPENWVQACKNVSFFFSTVEVKNKLAQTLSFVQQKLTFSIVKQGYK